MAILDPTNASGAEAAHHSAAYSGGAPVSAADCGASTASTSSSSFDELLMGLGCGLQNASRSSLLSAATDTQDSIQDESATNDDKPRPGAVQNPAPCGHNTWDNVRIKKGNHSLRCRLCQKQWKVHHSFFTRCNLFLKGRCDLGASCSQVHVYQYKEGLKERRGRFGDGVLEGVPVKILEGHGMLSKRKMARVESCSDEDEKARKLHPTVSQGSSSSQNTPPPKSPAESGAGFTPSAAQLKMPNGMAPGMMLPGMAQQMSHLNAMASPLAAAHAAAALRQPMAMPMMGGAGMGNPAQLQNAAAMSALTGVDLTTVLAVQQMNQMKQLSDVMAVMQLSASNANAANLAASMGLGQLGAMHGIGLPGSVGTVLPSPFAAQASAAGTPPFGNAAAASDPAALLMQQAAQNLQAGR